MLHQLLLILATLAGLTLAATAAYSLYIRTSDNSLKAEAEVDLITAQANHVESQAAAEDLLREKTIVAYENQGVAKFRTEIARLSGDIREVEKKLGSKLKGFTPAEHEAELAIARKRILDLEASLEALRGNGGMGSFGDQLKEANSDAALADFRGQNGNPPNSGTESAHIG